MTAIAILVAWGAAALYAQRSGTTWLPLTGTTIYVAVFLVGLIFAAGWAFWSRQRSAILGIAVLIVCFAIKHWWAWELEEPLFALAIIDLLVAVYFLGVGQTRWELMIGFLYLAAVVAGALTQFHVLPGPTRYDWGGLSAFAYPDVVAVIGHLANAILGFGAGDAGYRLKNLFRVRPRLAVARAHLFQREG